MRHAVMVDFGSTFTKLVVVDLKERAVLLSDKTPSTVGTDAGIGLNYCFARARETLGEENFEKAIKLASSSAAGGLRMSVIGLTVSLSSQAGRVAALGAGGKVIKNYVGVLNGEEVESLVKSDTEIVLLTGGYEHGNEEMVMENARKLADSELRVPVIYSGNSDVAHYVRALMKQHKKQCFIIDNLIPRKGELNVEPIQGVIRNLFLEQITNMKGFHEVKKCFDRPFVPTPVAVLAAGELLSRGTAQEEGLGPLMMVDVGGATTDVYSFHENTPYAGAVPVGIEEPYGKRTVEGDLGMRESAGGAINEENLERAAGKLGIPPEQLAASVKKRMTRTEYLPENEIERRIDNLIAGYAVYIAVRRHAGRLKSSYSEGCALKQAGKNLTDVRTVIGTGGILVFNENPGKILREIQREGEGDKVLLPEQAEQYLDTEYVLFSAGLLSQIDEDAALAIMKKSIKKCKQDPTGF